MWLQKVVRFGEMGLLVYGRVRSKHHSFGSFGRFGTFCVLEVLFFDTVIVNCIA